MVAPGTVSTSDDGFGHGSGTASGTDSNVQIEIEVGVPETAGRSTEETPAPTNSEEGHHRRQTCGFIRRMKHLSVPLYDDELFKAFDWCCPECEGDCEGCLVCWKPGSEVSPTRVSALA